MANNEIAKNTGFFGKIKAFFGRIGKFFKEVAAEVKQLTWPTGKELLNYCLAVVCFVALMALIIGLLDLAFGTAFQFLANLGK